MIELDGVNHSGTPAKRDLAMVFQTSRPYPHMTVRKNRRLRWIWPVEKKPEVDRKVTEAARILELGALLDRKPKQLSGGQRQGSLLAAAIVRNPRIFLFDEPLSHWMQHFGSRRDWSGSAAQGDAGDNDLC